MEFDFILSNMNKQTIMLFLWKIKIGSSSWQNKYVKTIKKCTNKVKHVYVMEKMTASLQRKTDIFNEK